MVNKSKSRGKLCGNAASLPSFSIDDCPLNVPAAGYRNGTSLNNDGSNGNYWSSTPNEDNTNNAYNLNFNSDDRNTNWNNRNNGQSVRPVSELAKRSAVAQRRRFVISREELMKDLYRAYKDARKNKRGRRYQLEFEFRLEENLVALCDELMNRTYLPFPSSCFIIHEPKMREVFAADFRDRIVHHLFYNYTHLLFERTFVHDSYSCIKNRGTHFGISRLRHHIRSVSAGYSKPCYILKIDIKGYFMSIDRTKLLEICRSTFEKMKNRPSDKKGMKWRDVLDFGFVDYLLETIVCCDPVENCIVKGREADWNKLPSEKSLFHSAYGCGLPIGNLSSQLFSNVYLNVLDNYVKRVLGCKHYGRYVDDAYVVSCDRDFLKSIIPQIGHFVKSRLGLSLCDDKVKIYNACHGVEFLGAYLKPHRIYISSRSLKRIKRNIANCHRMGADRMQSSLNSCLGVLSHYDCFCLRRVLLGYKSGLNALGRFDSNWLTFTR